MNYLIYKITNTLNGKIYIGAHKTKNINDSYMGSGNVIRKAIKKYGLENFKKEILFSLDSLDEMYSKERELVNEAFVRDEMTYNLKIGGRGGGITNRPCSEETKQKLRLANLGKNNPNYGKKRAKPKPPIEKKKRVISEETKEKFV